ncbi:glycerol-3-phosphate acyltransferase [Chloroflexota bacterium]
MLIRLGRYQEYSLRFVVIGITVGIIDASKGALIILIAQVANQPQTAILATGIAAVIGHNWPVFIDFRGGRGESTAIGVLLAVVTQPMLIVAGPALLTLFISRNVILASAILFIPLPLAGWWTGISGTLIAYSLVLPCLVGFTHFLRTRQLTIRQVKIH